MGRGIELARDAYWPTGTYGVLTAGDLTLVTVEQPWRGNKRFVSCIPDGEYTVAPWSSPKFGKCLIISGGTVVKTEAEARSEERYLCLFHTANRPGELQGCIAPGERRAYIPSTVVKGLDAVGVASSGAAMGKLMAYVGDEECKLTIKPYLGASIQTPDFGGDTGAASHIKRFMWPLERQ